MAGAKIKNLYASPNGDKWTLSRNSAGSFVVLHHPDPASGGLVSETELTDFLSRSGHGPEHQALQEALGSLGMNAGHDGGPRPTELGPEAVETLSSALGQAVVSCWSRLSQESQQDLFEGAVSSHGEAIREQLAIFLHGKHQRTLDALHAKAITEPDSLGG